MALNLAGVEPFQPLVQKLFALFLLYRRRVKISGLFLELFAPLHCSIPLSTLEATAGPLHFYFPYPKNVFLRNWSYRAGPWTIASPSKYISMGGPYYSTNPGRHGYQARCTSCKKVRLIYSTTDQCFMLAAKKRTE